MRKIYFTYVTLFILTFPSLSFPQSNNIFYLTQYTLKKQELNNNLGVDISQDWKFHQGDSSQWKKNSYNDSNWKIINTNFTIDSLSKNEQDGICWLRLNIHVGLASRGKVYALMLTQGGASEIYIDGHLIHEFGHTDKSPGNEIPYDPHGTPISLYLDSSSVHLIAIRYSYSSLLKNFDKFGKIFDKMGLTVSIGNSNYDIREFDENKQINSSILFSLSGILFALALLHFFMYVFYKNKRENLYYSLFTLLLSLFFVALFLISFLSNHVVNVIIDIISVYLIILALLFFILFLYIINYSKTSKTFYFFLAYIAFIIPFPLLVNFISYKTVNLTINIFFAVISIEGIRLIIHARIKKIDGVWIIGVGALTFIANILFGLLIPILKLTYLYSSQLFSIVSYSSIISLPISMSIYIARSFAHTNNELSTKIIEVQELSELTIENEKKAAEIRLIREQEKAKLREADLLAKALEAENSRKSQELEEARNLQLSMLPKNIPKIDNLDIAVYMKTSTEVGGDYYDFQVGSDGTLTIALGDATGHGLKAGTMVTAVKSLFSNFAEYDDIVHVLNSCNHALKRMNLNQLFMCLSIVKINGKSLKLSSAGIPPLLIYRNGTKTIEEIVIKAMPLGLIIDFPYNLRETILNVGDTILMMSDGYPEWQNNERELLGYEKTKDIFIQTANMSSEEIIKSLIEFGSEWANGYELKDDITLIAIKVIPG